MINKRATLATLAIATFGASDAHAGGADVTPMPIEIMFQKGNYAELSVARIGRDVTGTKVAPTGSMYPDYTATTIAIKTDIGEKISIGFADYLSAAILVDYRKAGATGATYTGYANAFVDLKIKSQLLAAKYQFDDNISILAGVKYSSTSDATANVLINPIGDLTIPSASGTAGAIGLAYEKPEIALRVSALYQSATKFKLPMTSTYYTTGSKLLDGKAGLPQSATITFQSGIAKDTLAFGSIHLADWGNAQVEFDRDNCQSPRNTYPACTKTGTAEGKLYARSSFTKSTTYKLGIGRKLSDTYSVSATYGWEKGSGNGTSLLSTTNGNKTVSLGAKYTNGPMSVSAGYSHIRLGDYTADISNTALGNVDAVFTKNTANVMGVKIGYSF